MFASLKEQLDCQAVLFRADQLADHVAHVGRVAHELVDTDSLQTIWEINELYDGGNERVATAAFQYYEAEIGAGFRTDPELVLASSAFRPIHLTFCFFDPAVTLNKRFITLST